MINNSSETSSVLTAEDLQHHAQARRYALHLIDTVLKKTEMPMMTSEIKDIARQRYNLDGQENERLLSNIARNIAYDNRISRKDYLDPNTNSVIGSEYCSVKMKEEFREKDPDKVDW